MNKSKTYPSWICFDCGRKYGRGMPKDHFCTMHNGVCGICGKKNLVTQPRDFGHLVNGWDKGGKS